MFVKNSQRPKYYINLFKDYRIILINIDKIIRRYSSKLNYMNISHHIKLSISK